MKNVGPLVIYVIAVSSAVGILFFAVAVVLPKTEQGALLLFISYAAFIAILALRLRCNVCGWRLMRAAGGQTWPKWVLPKRYCRNCGTDLWKQ